jgi:alkanesulfonate monooxygenase SsuD/methylene tetrahydromethanopterin reductase-like flavin-dependent oxidoreductase (luciferase family)
LKLGIGLPTWTGNLIDPQALLGWATRAEDAGFHAVAVHDKPNHDTYDPLAMLAAVAAITSRVRLVTAAVLLPPRDEALTAKQALVIDRLSGGRMDLGVAVGGRADDYELLGRPMAGRGRRFAGQLERMVALFDAAVEHEQDGRAMGPAPVQRPRPRLLVGGYQPAAIDRAARFGDGFVFGAPPASMMADRIPAIRAAAAQAGKPDLPVTALAYTLPELGDGARETGEALLLRYYGALARPWDDLVLQGDAASLRAGVARYADAGVDVLHLVPVTTDPRAIDVLADALLAAYPSS